MNLDGIYMYPHVTFDFLHIERQSDSNADIYVSSYIPTLNNNSVALITFDDNNNNCNGITDSALGYTFSIYREENDSNELEYITRINEGALSLVDYNIANQNKYLYYVFKEDEDYISAANTSNEVETCWWNWSITGLNRGDDGNYYVDTNNIWLFDLNVESADITNNFTKTEYQNLTQYPKVSIGKINYSSGALTCLLGKINNDVYYEPVSMGQAWRDFCASGETKLLKDRKGNILIVEIMSASSNIMDETTEQARTITFNWTQVGTSDGMTIMEET